MGHDGRSIKAVFTEVGMRHRFRRERAGFLREVERKIQARQQKSPGPKATLVSLSEWLESAPATSKMARELAAAGGTLRPAQRLIFGDVEVTLSKGDDRQWRVDLRCKPRAFRNAAVAFAFSGGTQKSKRVAFCLLRPSAFLKTNIGSVVLGRLARRPSLIVQPTPLPLEELQPPEALAWSVKHAAEPADQEAWRAYLQRPDQQLPGKGTKARRTAQTTFPT